VLGGRSVNGPITEIAELVFDVPQPPSVHDDVTPWASLDVVDSDFGSTVQSGGSDRRHVNDKQFRDGLYIAYDDGNYVGDESDGNREGFGECRYTDGAVYIGQWSANERHGNGSCWSANGEQYVGQWCENVQHGRGRLTRERAGTFHRACSTPFFVLLSLVVESMGDNVVRRFHPAPRQWECYC
jgi:hypothetical protein